MQIYLDSFGAFLSVKNGQFRVRLSSGVEHLFAVRTVATILLTKGTAMSTDAALLAVASDIPVLLINANTHFPEAVISSGRWSNTTAVRREQLTFSRSAEGMHWIARQLVHKIGHQRSVLAEYALHPAAPILYQEDGAVADKILAAMQQRLEQWRPPPVWTDALHQTTGETFRGQEGTASRVYFAQLELLVGTQMAYSGRSKRPAFDPFNALLNYLYGMLYTAVHLSLHKSGLDPHIGILHADRYGGAPVLVFDAIEVFRHWAERVAIELVLSAQITASDFEPDPAAPDHGWWLGAGKGKVIDTMLGYLGDRSLVDGKNTRRSVQIDLAARKLIAVMMREE